MEVIGVIDLKDGVVVRGVAGKRESYQPVQSVLCDDPSPLAVARGYREVLGLRGLYLADLDAIEKRRPNTGVYERLRDEGFELSIDAGVRDLKDLQFLSELNVGRVVIGMETMADSELLRNARSMLPEVHVLFSLDLMAGRPLTPIEVWREMKPLDIGREVLATGIDELLVLDLAGVGVGKGLLSAAVAQGLIAQHPEKSIFVGGGVRDADDLRQWKRNKVAGVLVASALHSGSITRADLHQLQQSEL